MECMFIVNIGHRIPKLNQHMFMHLKWMKFAWNENGSSKRKKIKKKFTFWIHFLTDDWIELNNEDKVVDVFKLKHFFDNNIFDK